MTTIAKFVAELGLNPAGLSSGLRAGAGMLQEFRRSAELSLRDLKWSGITAGAQQQGAAAASQLIAGLTSRFDQESAAAREALFNGVIQPSEFRRRGAAAAAEFNAGLSSGIKTLRVGGAGANITNALVGQFKEEGLNSVEDRLTSLSETFSTAGQKMRQVGSQLTSNVTLPLGAIGVASFKLAADAAESTNKFQVLFGKMGDTVNKQLEGLHREIPATSAQLQDMASQFQALLLPMGFSADASAKMSVRLVKLVGDITSLHNVGAQEVTQRIFSGLVGEAEAVRRFGADVSEARLQILAANAGLGSNVQALTRAQKTQLIYNEILRATAVATDDAKLTAGSAANQIRFLGRDFQEAAITIGRQLIPVLLPLMQSLSRVLESVSKLSPATLDFAIKAAGLASILGPTLTAFGALSSAAGIATIAIRGLTIATGAGAAAGGAGSVGLIAALAGPAGIVIALGIAAAALAGWAAYARGAALDVDKLAASFRGLTEAQLASEVTKASAHLQALNQRKATLTTAAPTGGSAAQQDIADIGGGHLRRVNQEIAETQARLNGLGTAWQNVASARAKEEADSARMLARTEAMFAALGGQMRNTAALAAADRKAQREWMQELAGTVSSLTDLHKIGVQFHQNVRGIEDTAVATFRTVQRALDATGGRFDANTARLLNMKAELLKIAAVARDEAFRTLDLPKLIQQTPGTGTRPPLANPQPFTISARQPIANIVTVPVKAPPPIDVKEPSRIGELLTQAAGGIAAGVSSMLETALGPMALLAAVLQPIIPVLEILTVPLELLGKILASSIVPVVKLLFPIFRGLAVVAAYLAEIIARVTAGIATIVGNVLVAIGKALNLIPFLHLGSGVEAAGRALQTFGTNAYAAAAEMKAGREQLQALSFDDAKKGVDALGDAAQDAADSVRNLPSWYKIEGAIFAAANARTVNPTDIGGAMGVGAAAPAVAPSISSGNVSVGSVNIYGSDDSGSVKSGRDLFREFIREARKEAAVTLGSEERWPEIV